MNNNIIIKKLEKILETGDVCKIKDIIKELRIEEITKETKNTSFTSEVKKFLKSTPEQYTSYLEPYKFDNKFVMCNAFGLIEFAENNANNKILERILH